MATKKPIRKSRTSTESTWNRHITVEAIAVVTAVAIVGREVIVDLVADPAADAVDAEAAVAEEADHGDRDDNQQ